MPTDSHKKKKSINVRVVFVFVVPPLVKEDLAVVSVVCFSSSFFVRRQVGKIALYTSETFPPQTRPTIVT